MRRWRGWGCRRSSGRARCWSRRQRGCSTSFRGGSSWTECDRPMTRQRPSVEQLEHGVRSGDRALLARAITLIESTRPADRAPARELLERLLPSTGGALRVGITGVPGVGKSTLIEALGKLLTARGIKLAVLAVDPSSTRSGGAILGDKTRMHELARDPLAFVRPSPSRGSLGGVARRTRE